MKIKQIVSLLGITLLMTGCPYLPDPKNKSKGDTASEVGQQTTQMPPPVPTTAPPVEVHHH